MPLYSPLSCLGSFVAPLLVAPLLVVAFALPTTVQARRSKLKPILTLKVFKGKKAIGTEELRVKSGETNTYMSTKSRLHDAGRRFGFRTHTILGAKGKLVTYDRWIDVKGATLRRRIFAFKGVWKLVVFAQRGRKNELTDLKLTGPILVLDPRSPTLISMAVDRLVGRLKGATTTNFVNVDTGHTGKLTMTVEYLADANGKRYRRYHLKGAKLDVSALKNAAGKTLEIHGIGRYSARNTSFKPNALLPAAAPTPSASSAPVDEDAPIAPPTGKVKSGQPRAAKPPAAKPPAAKPPAAKHDAAKHHAAKHDATKK